MTVHGPVAVGVADDQLSILDYAAREAVRSGCGLRLVRAYVVPPAPPGPIAGVDIAASYRAGGQDVLDAAVRHLEQNHPGLVIECVLTRGHTQEILEQESADARLMIIGPAARKPWYVKMFEGEVTHHLVRRAGCPVLVVPAQWPLERDVLPVVVLVGGDTPAPSALEFGHKTAQARGVELRVVHAEGVSRDVAIEAADRAGLLVLVDPHAQEIVGAASCPVVVIPAADRE